MTSATRLRLWAAAAPIGAVAALFVGLWALTYRRWTDVVVDFGRELYVAWRLAEGDVLGRDIAWFSGPLSVHVNALVFRLAGTSMWALEAWNTLIALAIFGTAFGLVAKFTTRWTAAVVTGTALAVFGFGQYGGIGNTNYVTPYSHEPVHGLLLGALSLIAARRQSRAGQVLAGVLLAATFLTKAEPFVAACAGWFALHVADPAVRRGWFLRCAAAAATLAAAFAVLCTALSPSEALLGLAGPWPHMLGGDVVNAAFYERLAGLDAPELHLQTTLRWTAGWGLTVACAALLSALVRRRLPALVMAALGLGVGIALFPLDAILDIGRPIGLAVALVLLLATLPGAKPRPDRPELYAWCVFALAWLPKLGLRQSFVFYGFVHTLPAFCAVAAALWFSAAERWERWSRGSAASYRALMLGLMLALAIVHVRSTLFWRKFKTEPVGSGADMLLADGRGDEVAAALTWLRDHTEPDASVLVLPEGLSLNYWSRRPTPTRYLGFMPTELAMFGEGAVIAALDAHPPDCVVVVHKDTSDYGVRFFGQDYGRELAAWISARYEPVASFGAAPFVDWRFGVVVMRPR